MLLYYLLGVIVASLPMPPLISGNEDPCSPDVYLRLPNLESRYDYYNTGTSVNDDSTLVPGWYNTGSRTILNHPPHGYWACGANYPIWQTGLQPTLDVNEEARIVLCYFGVFGTCETARNITVKLCPGDVYVYRLVATHLDSAYCFGDGKAGTAPTYTPAMSPVGYGLRTRLEDTHSGPLNNTELYFICNFIPSATKDLWYRVYWYQNDFMLYTTCFRKASDVTDLTLTEPLFVEKGFKLGNEISCEAQAFSEEEGPPGLRSERSKPFFAGIQIIDSVLIFHAGESVAARLRLSIPIACKYGNECGIRIKATIPDEDTHGRCSGLAIGGRLCGVILRSENPLNTIYEIKVTSAENGQYQTKDGFYEIYLETQAGRYDKLWEDYALPKISVHVQQSTGVSIDGKRCHSDNDPHMKTFDGRRYEMQQVNAVYTLYQHRNRDAEIQIRLKRCNNDRALCNCGIAVRVGQDVHKIDVCDTNPMFFDYVSCGDNALKVKSNTEAKYKILLPYGTYAEVDVQNLYRSKFLGIRIQPSSQDNNGMSSGLCGPLDGNQGNDLKLRDLSVVTDVLTFTNNWRVLDEKHNMFSDRFDKTGLVPFPYKVCVCRNATKQEAGSGDVTLYPVSCESNAVATCVQGKDTSADSCSPVTRLRRSIRRNPVLPRVKMNPNYALSKRKKRKASGIVWDADNSKTYCSEYVRRSSVYSLCSGIQNARPDEAIDNCALDLQITQDTEWANISAEGMQSACLAELYRNVSLRQKYNDGEPSIAEQIESIACINNCSFAGRCEKGECLCEEGLGGCDCSNDLNQPPLLQGILDNGLCDELEIPCTTAYIFGHFFTDSDNLTCKFIRFELSLNGDRRQFEEILVAAVFDSFIEVKCPIPKQRTKRSLSTENGFVDGYTVYVSNDGTHYGEGEQIYIYNSACQSPVWNVENATFEITNGSCFINGYCFEDGYIDVYDNCSVCDPQKNPFGWSVRLTNTDCVSTTADPILTTPNDVPTGAYSQRTPNKTALSSIPSKSTTLANVTSLGSIATKAESATTDPIKTNAADGTAQSISSTREASTNVARTGSSTQKPTSSITVASNTTTSSVLKHTNSTLSSKLLNNYTSTKTPVVTTTVGSSTHLTSLTHFDSTVKTSSSKEDRDTSTPWNTHSGKHITDTTSPDVSEAKPKTSSTFQERNSNTRSSANAVISTQSIISPESTAPSTDESPSTQPPENNLWIIGAVVPSVILLVMIIVVGIIYAKKHSNKPSRIQSTTNVQPDHFTRLSRRSLTSSSDKLFDYRGDVTPGDYHPPPKPENWPNVFQHFYVSQPPSATRLQNDYL